MTPAPDALLLTPQEVADLLRITRRQVARLGIPCVDLGARTHRYLRADVEAWLHERRLTAAGRKHIVRAP